jgi:hypothetical protein
MCESLANFRCLDLCKERRGKGIAYNGLYLKVNQQTKRVAHQARNALLILGDQHQLIDCR